MTRAEVRWGLAYGVFLAALTSVPYFLAAANQNPDWEFTGFLIAVEDGNSYLAKMMTGHGGAWLFRSPYSTVEQRGVFVFLPYLVLGKLTDGTHEQLTTAFHLFRVFAIPPLVLAIYRFSAIFVSLVAFRRWAVIIATLGGGLGWLLLLLGQPAPMDGLPLEFYSPETFGFLAAYALPHLTVARAAMFVALAWYLGTGTAWLAGVMLLLAGLIHPPELLPAFAALSAHLIAILLFDKHKKKWLQRLLRTVAPALPLVAYLSFASLTDPYLKAWAAQNLLPSPHPLLYLFAFGLLIVPAYLGARRLLCTDRERGLFPVAWALAIPVLAYVPVGIQRRLPEGGWVILAVLAAAGLASLSHRPQRIVRVVLASLLIPSSLLILVLGVQQGMNPRQPAFRPRTEIEAFAWIRDTAGPNDVTLAAFDSGNALPAWVPVKVVAGHGPESAGLKHLLTRIEALYVGSFDPSSEFAFLEEQSVDFVLHGPHERRIGDWNPGTSECLERTYSAHGYDIYRTCTS